MRTTGRLTRGVYMSGGGGLLAVVLSLAVLRGLMMLMIACVVFTVVLINAICKTKQRTPVDNRLNDARQILALGVSPEALNS